MLRVSFLIEGKHLEAALEGTTGKIFNLEVVPAVNGVVEAVSSEKSSGRTFKKRKHKARRVSAATNGTQEQRLLTHLNGEFKAGAVITTDDVRKILRAEHIKLTNCGPLVGELRKKGYLNRIGEGSYTITEKMNAA